MMADESHSKIAMGLVICVTDGNERGDIGVVRSMFAQKTQLHPSLVASDLASTIPRDELETLDRMATTIRLAAGHEITRKDGVGRECFVVIDGEFQVGPDGDGVVVGPGSVVGELALLTNKPRNASVVALTDASVYVLTPSEFSAALDACPQFARYVYDGALRRTLAA